MTTLKYGSNSSDVTQLQSLLNAAGDYGLDTDGIFGSLTQAAVRDYQARNGLAIDGIVGTNTWNSLLSSSTSEDTSDDYASDASGYTYSQSQSVTDAANALAEAQEAAPAGYEGQYTDQIQSLIDSILNRQDFSYDASSDPLYQQYSDMFQRQGQLAMMDTMGQAAALSGGYGNSYAQTAGQQAYQSQLETMNDVLPELQQLALDAYNQEGTDMYNDLSVLQSAEDTAYGQYRDTVSDYNQNIDYLTELYNTAYNNDFAQQQYAYQQAQDAIANSQWQQEYNLAVAQAASSGSSGSGSSSKAYSLIDDLQDKVDSGEITEEKATSIANAYYGIEETTEDEEDKRAAYLKWASGLTVEAD